MNAEAIIIRKMQDGDALRVSDIICAGYRWLADREGYSSEQLSRLMLECGSEEVIRSQRDACQFLVATRADQVLGVVSIEEAKVTNLFVDPQVHRQGIGTALLHAVERTIAGAGHEVLFLGAFESSIPFYEAMGLTSSQERTIDCGPLLGRRNTLMRKSLSESGGQASFHLEVNSKGAEQKAESERTGAPD